MTITILKYLLTRSCHKTWLIEDILLYHVATTWFLFKIVWIPSGGRNSNNVKPIGRMTVCVGKDKWPNVVSRSVFDVKTMIVVIDYVAKKWRSVNSE